MIRAYQKDKKLSIQTDNSYLSNMILKEYRPNSTFSPIENIKNSRMGLEKISTHLTYIMLQNFINLEQQDITGK